MTVTSGNEARGFPAISLAARRRPSTWLSGRTLPIPVGPRVQVLHRIS